MKASSITWLALAFVLAACGGTAVIDAGSEPGAGGDGAGGAQGETCGDVVCNVGQVCCNESCSICTAPNEDCAAIACE